MTKLQLKSPIKKDDSTIKSDKTRLYERDMFLVKLIDRMDTLDSLVEELWHDDDLDMIDAINSLRNLSSDLRDDINQEAEKDLQHRKSK